MEVILLNVRLAFAQHIWEKGSISGGKEQFSCKGIFEAGSKAHKALLAAQEQVTREKWTKPGEADKMMKIWEKTQDGVVQDGDLKPNWDGFEGNLYVNTNSDRRPTIVDRDQSPLAQSDGKPYGGCKVNMILDVWAQDNGYGKKVNATLTGLQFVEDGDTFGAGAPPADASKFPTLAVEDDDDDLLG